MISPDDHKRLKPLLLPGERLLWVGRPKGGIAFRSTDLYLVPLSFLWAGFALFWNLSVWSMPAPEPFFELWGLPFLAMGAYFVAGRFVHEAWLRAHLLYAVTSRRVIVVRMPPWQRLKSLEIGYLPVLDYEEHRDGRGTLIFDFDDDEGNPWWSSKAPRAWLPPLKRMRFDRIEQPRLVYDLVRREADRGRIERTAEAAGPRGFIG
ncbi:MAG: hypothetical protein ACJ8EB_11415 [Allosphingosinicella sp.]